MSFDYDNQVFMTDNDLDVKQLGFFPGILIKDPKLRNALGSHYIGGDILIGLRQRLVAKEMEFQGFEEELIEMISDVGVEGLKDALFKKHSSGITRGHSLGGLSGIVFGISGSKMIDSGLTGLVASRSLVTSGRRRAVNEGDVVIPESLTQNEELLREYVQISKDAIADQGRFREKFKRSDLIEAFNRGLAYNNPGDLIIVLPLDSMATLHQEVMFDRMNPNGPFVPREIHTLVDKFPDIAKEVGIGTMYRGRTNVPRQNYLHYTVFRDPDASNLAIDLAIKNGMPTKPMLVDSKFMKTEGFMKGLERLRKAYGAARGESDPEALVNRAMEAMLATQDFCDRYNEAVRATIIDALSFRVWSEQKRHATLGQHVESIYSAANRAVEILEPLWDQIEHTYEEGGELPLEDIQKAIVIDGRLKSEREVLNSHIYHSTRQLLFYAKLVNAGILVRDAAYSIPRNTLTRNLEEYDLVNLIGLELPLRLCKACEPERLKTSWAKRQLLKEEFPELEYFLQPKCGVGMCTEGKLCGLVSPIRGKGNYSPELHRAALKELLSRARAV